MGSLMGMRQSQEAVECVVNANDVSVLYWHNAGWIDLLLITMYIRSISLIVVIIMGKN